MAILSRPLPHYSPEAPRTLNGPLRFATPVVPKGIKEVHEDIWLVSFMQYDLGYFDLETRVLEPLENPFGPKLLPMS